MPSTNAYNNQYHTLHDNKWAFLFRSTNEEDTKYRSCTHALESPFCQEGSFSSAINQFSIGECQCFVVLQKRLRITQVMRREEDKGGGIRPKRDIKFLKSRQDLTCHPQMHTITNIIHCITKNGRFCLIQRTRRTRNIGYALMPWYHRFAGRDHSHPLLISFQSVNAGVGVLENRLKKNCVSHSCSGILASLFLIYRVHSFGFGFHYSLSPSWH